MRLLYLNHNVVRGGGTFFRAFHFGRCLARRGHTVTLLSISPTRRWGFEREEAQGVEIIHTPDLLWGVGRTGWDLWDALNRVAWLRGRRWDLVHAWDSRPVVVLPALYARRQARAPLVMDWCDWWGRGGTQAERPNGLARRLYGPVETFFEEAFRRHAQATTTASEALRQRALSVGARPEPMLVLPGGSDVETIRPQPAEAARGRLGLPASAWIVGFLGAITVKETRLLMDALQQARAAVPNLRLLAVGTSIAGSTLPFRAAAGCEGCDWVHETGRVAFEQVGDYLAACDACLLPLRDNISNRARWPSKVNDYLAAGRPVVATAVGEVGALLERHAVGMAAPPEAPALAAALARLHADPALARRLGENARALAEGELNWARLAERLEAFYCSVVGGQPPNTQ